MRNGAVDMDVNNRRDHFRVEIIVPAKWQLLNQQEIELVNEGLESVIFKTDGLPSPIDEILAQTAPGSEEEHMYHSLQFINNKLDFIIEQLLPNSMKSMTGQGDVFEISASGLKFICNENLEIGNLIKMNLILPGTFKYQMNFIAEVMRVEEKDIGFITAVRYTHINDDDRDSIIDVVFRKQRLDIRVQKSREEKS